MDYKSFQVRNFVNALEYKLEQLKRERFYDTRNWWQKFTIKITDYLGNIYVSQSRREVFGFDFPIDEDDMQYFIDKYTPIAERLEVQEEKEKLQRLKRQREELDNEICKLNKNEC